MAKLLKRMQTVSTFTPHDKKKLTLRKRMRIFTDDRRVEGTTMCIVLLYFFFIMLDFIVPEVVYTAGDSKVTGEWKHFTIVWQRAFWCIDLLFLTFFLVEIGVRIFAWGYTYLRDVLNIADLLIVLGSFIMLWVTLDYTMLQGANSGLDTALALLRVFRIVRIFRIIIIINKFKRTRETAEIMRKKAKYKRQGSPVERVLDILAGIKRKSESGAERDNIAFMMDVIVSGDLYTVSLASAGQVSEVDSAYNAFLLDGGAKAAGASKSSKRLVGMGPSPKMGRRAAPDSLQLQTADGELGQVGPRGPHFKLAPELKWVADLYGSEAVSRALESVNSWDFSIFELDKASNRHPMAMLVMYYVEHLKLDQELPIDHNNLVRLMLNIEQGYKDVPFHNYVHGADVTHGTAYFMQQPSVAKHLSALDQYCMIIGAAMHDYAHPGYNNAFLVASKHETAILYNDSSVLENFHIASSWKVMLQEDSNPFAGFSLDQYKDAREKMVHAILGTDMKFHFEHLTKFKTRLSSGAFDAPERKDVMLLLAMCMHSADVSNPAKNWELSMEWACRVMEEFFQQGEKEADLGLPVSPFMDRVKTDIGKCQAGFISILIKPFFEEWVSFLGADCKHIVENIEANIRTWQEKGEGAIGARAERLHEKPKGRTRHSES